MGSSQYTRQNPNGNRRGLECPEERDYYPWWNPTPFQDVAILTDNLEDCRSRFDYQGNSQNTERGKKWACVEKLTEGQTQGVTDDCFKYMHNMTKCEEEGCKSQAFFHDVPEPICEQAPWTRANSLGNGRDGKPTFFNLTLPRFDKGATRGTLSKYTKVVEVGGCKLAKCILRIRYNITTDDYDPHNTTASQNQNYNAKPVPIVSPVQQNPTVDIGLKSLQGLRLAINTNQFGRTFQDRSHTWYLMGRECLAAGQQSAPIQNMIVRGKRGNIVQTFPAVEYDFSPKRVVVNTDTLVHIQWTGSNTHNNGNPAGDGQAGDAGEGTGGTDRQNIVPLVETGANYITPMKSSDPVSGTKFDEFNLYKQFECFAPTEASTTFAYGGGSNTDNVNWASNNFNSLDQDSCALRLSSANYYRQMSDLTKADNTRMNVLLNNAPASFAKGLLLQGTKKGNFEFMCSRNNNFSNRSQKGVIIVE